MRGGGYQIVVRPSAFASVAGAFLARKLAAAGGGGPVSLALSGGGTPGPVYQALAASPHPDWERTDIFFADERAVAPDHPASNYRLAREMLLERAGIPAERVHPMFPDEPAGDDEALERAARAYEDLLPPRLDILILGLGEDGHTASLFPGSEALSETRRRVVPAVGPTEPRRRLTITPAVIQAARLVVVLARGPGKREAVRRALQMPGGTVRDTPGRLALHGIWILDREAAPAVRP